MTRKWPREIGYGSRKVLSCERLIWYCGRVSGVMLVIASVANGPLARSIRAAIAAASLAAAGAILGLSLGHLAAATIGSWLPAAAPLAGAAWRFVPAEGVVVALAIAGGILAACWPAWRASRLDVAATLADT